MYGVAHIGVAVTDLGKSTEFYCKVVGCEVVDRYEDERVKIAFLKAGEGVLELIQYLNVSEDKRGTGIVDHIAFDVEDVDKASETAKAQGVKMLFDAPKVIFGGTRKIIFFEGPDGEKLEFIQSL